MHRKLIIVLAVSALLGSLFFASSSSSLSMLPNSNSIASHFMLLAPVGNRHPPLALESGCNRLKLDKSESTVPSFAGSPSTLVYACNPGSPAFSTLKSASGSTPSVIPIFSVPSGWTLGVGISRPSGECSSKNRVVTLISGGAIVLRSGAKYVYCLSSPSASSFTMFSISWSQ